MLKATAIIVTEELAINLANAQADHTAEILRHKAFCDDMGDYTNSALETMRTLFECVWDQMDLEGLAIWLNTPVECADDRGEINLPQSGGMHTHLGLSACDGICSELYDLNCIALEEK